MLNQIKESKFVANVAKMLTGNIIAQAIALIAALVITRLYSPVSFGIMSIIWSVVNVCATLACLGYQETSILPSQDEKAVNLLVLSLTAAFASAIIYFGAVYVFMDVVDDIIGLSGQGAYLWFVPLATLLTCWRESLVIFQVRFGKITVISISVVILALTTSGSKILFGSIFKPTAFWLLTCNLLGIIVSLGYILITLDSKAKSNIKRVSTQSVKYVASEYQKFPRYNMPADIINSLSSNIPTFILAYYFNNEVVGFFGLASTVLHRPVSIMSQSISKVFLQKSADLNNKGKNLYPNLKKATIGLAMIGILPFGILALAGEWIFSFIFGVAWAEAGRYTQILTFLLFFDFINPPANQVLLVKQELRFKLYFDIVMLILRFSSIYLAIMIFNSPLMAILFFSICGILMNIYFIFYSFKVALK